MSLVMILLTIFLPPVAVLIKEGLGLQFLINILLTLIGWLPGVIHAFWVNTRGGSATIA
ncbi:MAG: YqaE/Pmp3 family membrane protein [Pannonibacter indicus]